jgi:hypothetical protein
VPDTLVFAEKLMKKINFERKSVCQKNLKLYFIREMMET